MHTHREIYTHTCTQTVTHTLAPRHTHTVTHIQKRGGYLALPTILGDGGHGRSQTEGVVALVTGIAHQHLDVVPRLSANTHTHTFRIHTGIPFKKSITFP